MSHFPALVLDVILVKLGSAFILLAGARTHKTGFAMAI